MPRTSRAGRSVADILADIRKLAIEYYDRTGKPLGVTGEIAEFEAARLLGLTLCDARQPGYDAVRNRRSGPQRVQIKGRRVTHRPNPGQRLGRIRLNTEWDSVVLVLLDEQFAPVELFEAERPAAETALKEPGSRARNDRGQLGLGKFKAISKRVWARD